MADFALLRLLRRIGRAVPVAGGTLLALVGAATANGTTLPIVMLFAGGAGLVAREHMGRDHPPPLPPEARRTVLSCMTRTAVTVLAVAGTVAVAGPLTGGLIAAVGLAVVAAPLRRRPQPRPRAAAPLPVARPRRAANPHAGRADGTRPGPIDAWGLRRRPTTELVQAWRHSFVLLSAVAGDPHLLGQVSEQRRAYLDELASRDPDGFRRWIDSGARAAGDPSRYLSDASPQADGGGEAVGEGR